MPARTRTMSEEFDELTGLPNMVYFRRYAPVFAGRTLGLGKTCYLMYFNLENFSGFNARYGFEEGDSLLKLCSVALYEAFPGFLLSRISEDHFLLVTEAHNVAAQIMSARNQLHAYGRHANVELKVGVYEVTDVTENIGLACDRAKAASDAISHRYDQVFRFYDATLSADEERRRHIENNIDRAVNEGWIKVFYQPVVRAVTGEVCEFEALARWDDPIYGMLSPGLFVEVLERAHLIHKLDACVIEQVCAEWHYLNIASPWRMPVSVNLSRLDFELCDAFSMVNDLARAYHVPHQMLHIEVTESALNENADLLAREVVRFREANYQVWLDDFGSGYSSLNTLKDYVFDVVKLDMVFLREIDTKPKSRVIIASVVNMAKQLGMQTLVEGVETPEQFAFLRDIGCEFMQGYLIGRPSQTAVNIERIRSGELVAEDVSLHGYYDRIGGVNTLSASPFEFGWDEAAPERSITDMMPLAIFERTGGDWHVLLGNVAFADELKAIGDYTPASFIWRVNNRVDRQAHSVADTFEMACETDRVESVDVIENGRHCMIRCRRVASHDQATALLVSVLSLSRFSDVSEEHRLQLALRYLYAVYDLVNIFDLTDNTISTIYKGSSIYPEARRGMDATAAVDAFTESFIHPIDRERYRAFVDPPKVEERVIASGRNHLSDAFRVHAADGSYQWSTVELVPMQMDGQQTVLMCLRKANQVVIDRVTADEQIPKSILWDTLLDLVPAGVFWKDRDRRFVGVNRNFLEFYEFSSVDDVLGKNDEDMGWHVDEGPFMSDELKVILKGEPVIAARGTCIAHGEVRNIAASKVPLRQNGQIIGLLGYFTDLVNLSFGERSLMVDGFDRMKRTDRLTGIANLDGFASSALAFEEAYRTNGTDFCCVSIDICDMGGLNEVYGHFFGNRILKVVARALERSVNVSGAVARVGGDKFAALFRVDEEYDVDEGVTRLLDALASVREVDGIAVHLGYAVGHALFSEAGDMEKLVLIADERRRSSNDWELISRR